MSRFAAVLLAGGASTRMGQAKAFLPYRGLPLWRFQMNTLLALEPDELLVSAPSQIDWEKGPWTVLRDREAGLGPLAGLEAALRQTVEQRLVVLAVDMPAVTTQFLRTLLDEAGEDGVVPSLDGFYHGTVAVYPSGIHPLVEDILATSDRSLQRLVKAGVEKRVLKIHPVSEIERPLFKNLNTPSDLSEPGMKSTTGD